MKLVAAVVVVMLFGAAGPASQPMAAAMTPFAAPTAEQAASAKKFRAQGDAAFAAKKYTESVGDYRGAVAADPSDAENRYRLGVALAATGDLSGAIAAWEGVLLVSPKHEKARRNIELARKRLAKADKQSIDDVAMLQKARQLIADGRFESAAVVLDRVLADKLHEDDVDALALRAEARLGQGDAQGAVVDWLRVLALDARHPGAFAGLGKAYAALGDLPRATYYAQLAELK
jgi:tetratricopeptide (TPR) repeat protein